MGHGRLELRLLENNIVITKNRKERFDLQDAAAMVGWIVSSLIVGAAFGAAFSGILSDKYGRKTTLIISAVLFVIGSLGSAIPNSVAGLVISRIIGGLGVGMASTLSPLYIAEIAPARNRGLLVSIYQFAVVTGIFVTFFINAAIAGIGDDAWDVAAAWRWMLGFGVIPGVLFIFLLLFIPETPRWLMKQKQEVRALEVLERMNGKEAAKSELEEILNLKESDEGAFRELFRPALRLPLIVGVVLAVLQQITGINAIMYYAPEIFKQTGAGRIGLLDSILHSLVCGGFRRLVRSGRVGHDIGDFPDADQRPGDGVRVALLVGRRLCRFPNLSDADSRGRHVGDVLDLCRHFRYRNHFLRESRPRNEGQIA